MNFALKPSRIGFGVLGVAQSFLTTFLGFLGGSGKVFAFGIVLASVLGSITGVSAKPVSVARNGVEGSRAKLSEHGGGSLKRRVPLAGGAHLRGR